MQKIKIYKLDHSGREVWNYSGTILERDQGKVIVDTIFDKPDFVFNGMILKKGDPFIEAYYRNKWYNIMEIYDRDDGHLKGWYCNITRPAVISRWKISYQDLALDLLVHYNGSSMLLDEDEFHKLDLLTQDVEQAWKAIAELQSLFNDNNFRLTR